MPQTRGYACRYADVSSGAAQRPAKELVTRSKLACLSWHPQESSRLISSDYEGIVTLWDAEVSTPGLQAAFNLSSVHQHNRLCLLSWLSVPCHCSKA